MADQIEKKKQNPKYGIGIDKCWLNHSISVTLCKNFHFAQCINKNLIYVTYLQVCNVFAYIKETWKNVLFMRVVFTIWINITVSLSNRKKNISKLMYCDRYYNKCNRNIYDFHRKFNNEFFVWIQQWFKMFSVKKLFQNWFRYQFETYPMNHFPFY